MLSIKAADTRRDKNGRLAVARYYIDYAQATSTPPKWVGTQALEALGLEAGKEANPELFLGLAERGEAPDGTGLSGRARAVPFFDLTFSLPKSLSILAYCHPDEATRTAIRDVLEESVQRTVEWMETELIRSRRGYMGRDGVVDAKIVGVGFRHATNRNDQPHGHIHLLVANLCLGEDGRWRSLDGASLYGLREPGAIVRAASQVHDAIVRDLCRERGIHVDWTAADEAGLREVAGFGRATIEDFSRDLGLPKGSSWEARQVAAYRTRSKKSEALPDDLVPGWLEKLAARGWTPAKLAKLAARREKKWSAPSAAAILKRLTSERATFSRVELLGVLALAAVTGADPERLERWADRILTSDLVVAVTPAVERVRGVAFDPTPQRFTTPEVLQEERAMLELAMACRKRGGPNVATTTLEAAIEAAQLDEEQAAVVRHAASPGLVKVIEAEAGTGKTHSLNTLVQACDEVGVPVIGFAVAGRAVVELQEGGGVEAHTIASWKEGGEWAPTVPQGGIVIVDEASMVPTGDLSRFVLEAHAKGCRVVLVGDREQLGAVEAGGGFSTLADKLGAASLTTNRRLVDEALVEAAKAVRSGRAVEAVGKLSRIGAFVVGDDPEKAMQALLDDWWAAREQGHSTAILAYHRSDTQALNAAAQARMREAGKLSEECVELPSTTAGKGLPARSIHVGDEIVCLRKHRSVKANVVNGTRGRVAKISKQRVTILSERGEVHHLPLSFVADYVDLGYATTDHKAQGSTVGRAAAARRGEVSGADVGEVFVFGGEQLSRQAIYVALTRATDRTRIYCSRSLLADDEWHDGERDPLGVAARKWEKTEAKDLGVTEAERAARVVELASTLSRSELERRYQPLSDLITLGRVDLDAALEEARDRLDEAVRQGEDEAVVAAAQARLEALEEQVEEWKGSPPDLVRVRAEADLLADALTLQRRGVILETVGNPPAWLVEALGEAPVDPRDTHLWSQAVGCLTDAEHWVTEARLASKSPVVQATANPDTVHADLLRAVRSNDARSLEELVDEEGVEAAVQVLVSAAEPKFAHDLSQAPVVRRTAAAAAASNAVPSRDEVREAYRGIPRDDDEQEQRTGRIAFAAARLRSLVARHLPKDSPASARLAVTPGVTFPAVRATTEAIKTRQELEGREAERQARKVWREITLDLTPEEERRPQKRARAIEAVVEPPAPVITTPEREQDGPSLSLGLGR